MSNLNQKQNLRSRRTNKQHKHPRAVNRPRRAAPRRQTARGGKRGRVPQIRTQRQGMAVATQFYNNAPVEHLGYHGMEKVQDVVISGTTDQSLLQFFYKSRKHQFVSCRVSSCVCI